MLSVPAIGIDSVKRFICEAAIGAGLENVRLVLEPKARQHFASDKPLKLTEKKSTEKFAIGYKYSFAELGGGTIDICVHEEVDGRRLSELYRAIGDHAGSTRVNHEITSVLVKLITMEHVVEVERKVFDASNCSTRKQVVALLNNLIVKEFFHSSVIVIMENLKEVLSACSRYNIATLPLVGGYSKSSRKNTERYPNRYRDSR
ncbi:uncharacterized protein LOC128244114 [Mya arenaria]|uniref:uncharacterized protein LOC128244114 n=1 Tax=Mya arenaria TaxID=6604 RepID=UPI0022E668D1|nr:uncharacterized protein LOC128244114 [Mya arenaria]